MEPEATPPTERLGGDLKTRQHILLNSNEPPLDSEVVIVQSAIVKADGRLAWLANEISQLRDRLQRLEEEQVSLSSFRAQNRAILSPLRRMPPEVLSEIFAWASPLAKLRKMRITDSPWLFTHVSRRWRAVAILNPSLWSLVVISCHSGPDQSPCYPTAMVETQVSRAHTLKVHFHGCETSDSRPQLEMFQSLTKHASRWEELGITLTSFLVPLLADLRGRLPLLRRLWIQWADQASQVAEESIQCFQTAPSLVDVSVNHAVQFIPVSFPAQQLTRYELSAPWDIHQGILRITPNLIEACITISFDSHWSQPESIELLCLRRLYISAPIALTCFKFPLLEEISFYLHAQEADSDLMHLQSSLMRSSCRLRKLCIQGCNPAPRVAELLQKFPSIVDLAIMADTPAASAKAAVLLDILDKPALGSSVVAPQLSRLSFGCVNEGSLNYGRFSEVVKYRWEDSFCTLKSAVLYVDMDSGPDAAVLSGLNALREKGLDFIFLDGLDAWIAMEAWLYHTEWIHV